ncbi:hypothetical protein HMPREF1326_03067, partial [Akkermansia sp. KLE1605]
MRGLKPGFPVPPPPGRRSHLTRGAWIETSGFWLHRFSVSGRTSHEVRGLKLKKLACIMRKNMSHLTRGAWIETMMHGSRSGSFMQSHLTRGAWIETICPVECKYRRPSRTSHEVRGLK